MFSASDVSVYLVLPCPCGRYTLEAVRGTMLLSRSAAFIGTFSSNFGFAFPHHALGLQRPVSSADVGHAAVLSTGAWHMS
eukprot:1289368-Rhodomonas_salina.3